MKNKLLAYLALLLALGGLIDASYLMVEPLQGAPVVCGILEGCENVLASVYSTIGGNFPVAALGIGYYGILVLLMVNYLGSKNERTLILASYFTIIGFLASLWFLYLQVFVIKAFCFYCLISAGISAALSLMGLYCIINRGRIIKNVYVA